VRDVCEELLREAEEMAKSHEVLANPIRVLVLAALIALGGEGAWSDIKRALERVYGSINPNTLAFHLRKLIENGLVDKVILEEPRYVVKRAPNNLQGLAERLKSVLRG